MKYEIVTEVVAARPIAVVRRRVLVGRVSTSWRPALDIVWAFLRRHDGLRTDGHNIFVYHHPAQPGAPMEVDFGVEVTGAFADEDEVVFAHTPAGQVAWTLHRGPYDQLAGANAAIGAWCLAHGRLRGGVSWEIYGDPSDDPAYLEVQVFYLLG
jgi:effector-binding domain-containing protein